MLKFPRLQSNYTGKPLKYRPNMGLLLACIGAVPQWNRGGSRRMKKILPTVGQSSRGRGNSGYRGELGPLEAKPQLGLSKWGRSPARLASHHWGGGPIEGGGAGMRSYEERTFITLCVFCRRDVVSIYPSL